MSRQVSLPDPEALDQGIEDGTFHQGVDLSGYVAVDAHTIRSMTASNRKGLRIGALAGGRHQLLRLRSVWKFNNVDQHASMSI